jgi:histidinol-phosphate phosphatase family protein
VSYAVVVPTTGRRGLARLLMALDKGDAPPPAEIVVVDDRRQPDSPLNLPDTRVPLRLLRSGGRGWAAARNRGWRAVSVDWVVFVSDAVVTAPDWPASLAVDLADLPDDVAGSLGVVRVPWLADNLPAEWDLDAAESGRSSRIAADVAYRRSALVASRGFDERFRRPYREDEDLALRLAAAGLQVVRGTREVIHPAPPVGFWSDVRAESGDADDVLMRQIHGPGWRDRTNAPSDRFARHLWTCGAAACAVAAARGGRRLTAAAAALTWAGLTGRLAASRLHLGPRSAADVLRAAAAGAAIPPATVAHRIAAEVAARRVRPPLPAAVLFDRDGTLIDDASDRGDPDAVVTMPGAREALGRLRDLGVPVGVVSTQPGIARGVVEPEEVAQVNHRVETLLGPFDAWEICPHSPNDSCMCRQPRPGLIQRAAATLGVAPEECVVIGDVGGDVAAAQAAGARGILVPTPRTDPEEVVSTPEVASDLVAAVELALDGKGTRRPSLS